MKCFWKLRRNLSLVLRQSAFHVTPIVYDLAFDLPPSLMCAFDRTEKSVFVANSFRLLKRFSVVSGLISVLLFFTPCKVVADWWKARLNGGAMKEMKLMINAQGFFSDSSNKKENEREKHLIRINGRRSAHFFLSFSRRGLVNSGAALWNVCNWNWRLIVWRDWPAFWYFFNFFLAENETSVANRKRKKKRSGFRVRGKLFYSFNFFLH